MHLAGMADRRWALISAAGPGEDACWVPPRQGAAEEGADLVRHGVGVQDWAYDSGTVTWPNQTKLCNTWVNWSGEPCLVVHT
jgi:hypothetical protein